MSLTEPSDAGAGLPPQPPEDELLSFTCPRCRLEVTELLYGPCASCRTTLRAVVGAINSGFRGGAVEEYVPKMNVTPNAVASKD